MNKRLIYHGSYIKIEHPLVNVGRQDLDFGRGFYTTDLREQAVKWARIIQQRRIGEGDGLQSQLPLSGQRRGTAVHAGDMQFSLQQG